MFTVTIMHPPEYKEEEATRLTNVILTALLSNPELDDDKVRGVFARPEGVDGTMFNLIDIEIEVSCKIFMSSMVQHPRTSDTIKELVHLEFTGATVLCYITSPDSDTVTCYASQLK